MVTKFVRLMALVFCIGWAGSAQAISVGLVPTGPVSSGSGSFTALINPINGALDFSSFDTVIASGPLAGSAAFISMAPVAGSGTMDLNPFALTPSFGTISMVGAIGANSLTAQVDGLSAFGGGAAILTISGFGFTGGTNAVSNILAGVDPILGFATFSSVRVDLQALAPIPVPLSGLLLISAFGIVASVARKHRG